MKEKLEHLDHSLLPPFLPKEAQILILGSFPSRESRKQGFYYANKHNRFFPVLASLFKEEVPVGTEERKIFLFTHRIALSDVIFSCDIHASSDTSIKNVVPMDIPSRLEEYPIKKVFTTGKKASDLYHLYFGIDNISLPSTSSANAARTREELVKKYSVILKYLCPPDGIEKKGFIC